MEVIMTLTKRVVVFNQGHVIASGTPEAVVREEAVIEAYLGRRHRRPPPTRPRMRGRAREWAMAELTVEHLEVRYGDLVGVADISLARRGRAGRGAARLQRRRQDHDAQCHRRPGARRRAGASNGAARRFPASRPTPSSARVWRCRRKAGGCSSRQTRRAESASRRHRAGRPLAHRGAVRARLCAVSAARRAAPPIGRHVVRRRTADAGARPRADERAAVADARRAEPRPGARRGRGALRHAQRAAPPRPHAVAGRAVDPAGARHRRLCLCAADRAHRACKAPRRSSNATKQVREIYLGIGKRAAG